MVDPRKFGDEKLKEDVYQEEKRLNITGFRLGRYFLAMFSYLLGSLEEKRILDVGCGGDCDYKTSFGFTTGKEWPPLFPRLAKRYDVDVIGLDPTINPEQENFSAIRGYVEDLPQLFAPKRFDDVFISNFWNQPEFEERHRVLQNKSYREIFRILRRGGVSINFSNQSNILFPPSKKELNEIGFRIIYYFSGDGYGDDLVVLRKPEIQ